MARKFTLSLLLLPVFAWFVFAQDRQNDTPIEFALFDNAYELQKNTGYDLGFPPFSGSGGSTYGVDTTLKIEGDTFFCTDAIATIYTHYDLIYSGSIYCPVADFNDTRGASHETASIIEKMNESPNWFLHKSHMTELGLFKTEPTTIEDAFLYLVDVSNNRHGIARVPLMTWRSNKHRSSLALSATIHWRDGDSRLRYELSFSSDNRCFGAISSYNYFAERNRLDTEEYVDSRAGLASMREYFSGRIYSEIPDEERVALTHKYVTELCENMASWD